VNAANGSADRSEVKRNANLGHLSGEKTWVYRQGGACNCKGGAHTCDRNELFTVCVFLDKSKQLPRTHNIMNRYIRITQCVSLYVYALL